MQAGRTVIEVERERVIASSDWVINISVRARASKVVELWTRVCSIRFTGGCSDVADGGPSWPACRSNASGRMRLPRGEPVG
jgi:hypothetical protein